MSVMGKKHAVMGFYFNFVLISSPLIAEALVVNELVWWEQRDHLVGGSDGLSFGHAFWTTARNVLKKQLYYNPTCLFCFLSEFLGLISMIGGLMTATG